MPDSLLGLLIFVLLLAPGFTYSSYRSRSRPVEKPSALQELSGIALRSVAYNALAVGLFAIARAAVPGATPDVGALIRSPERYFKEHYGQLASWASGLLVLACLMALMAALVASKQTLSVPRWLSWAFPKGGVGKEPAWWVLFEANPEDQVYAGCTLEDGTYLGGWINSYSPDSDETADRELTLAGPITFRGPDDDEPSDPGVSAVSISARRLSYLTVTYLPTGTEPAAIEPEVAPPAGDGAAPSAG